MSKPLGATNRRMGGRVLEIIGFSEGRTMDTMRVKDSRGARKEHASTSILVERRRLLRGADGCQVPFASALEV